MGDSSISEADRIVEPDESRKRGVLTEHDRRFLRDVEANGVREGMSDGAKRQKRKKIRDRFKNAILDLQYILLTDDRDFGNIFPGENISSLDKELLYANLLGVAYHSSRNVAGINDVFSNIEVLLSNDISREYSKRYGLLAPPENIQIEVTTPDPDDCEYAPSMIDG